MNPCERNRRIDAKEFVKTYACPFAHITLKLCYILKQHLRILFLFIISSVITFVISCNFPVCKASWCLIAFGKI